MAFRRGNLLPILLILALSGCFRQASDPLDDVDFSVSNTAAPGIPTQAPTNPPVNTPEGPTQVPVITSTPIPPPTSIPPTQAPQQPTEALPTDSVNQPAPMFTPSPTAQQFITPNAQVDSSAIPTATATTFVEPTTVLVTPTDIPADVPDECIYIVQGGDNLFRIALNNGYTLAEVVAANPGITPELIQPGDEIVLPGCSVESSAPVQGQEPPTAAPQTDALTPEPLTHTVASGETLGAIARRYGVSQLQIVQANNLSDPNALSIGQELIIPVGQ